MFEIRFTTEAERHLAALSARARGIVIAALEEQLKHQPNVVTRNRKQLRENPYATWELRAQKYRVLYNIDEGTVTVYVVAIAVKDGNRFIIDGNRFIIDGEEVPL